MGESNDNSSSKLPVDVDVKVEVSKESVDKVVDAVADILSPATEFLGALGDKVRVYRTEAALRALRRAQTIANKEGLKLKAPPLKFLVPYLEKVSLEVEDSELSERWAKLLVSASIDFDEDLLLFNDILSQLGPKGAKTINFLGGKIDSKEDHFIGLRYQISEFNEVFDRWFDSEVISKGWFPDYNNLPASFSKMVEEKPIMLISIGSPMRDYPNVISHIDLEFEWGASAFDALSLQRLGLMSVSLYSARFNILDSGSFEKDDHDGDYPFDIDFGYLTLLGFRLYQRCELLPSEK